MNFDVLNVESNKPTLQASKVSSQVFSQGDVVYHPNLGTGTIQLVTGEGDGLIYDIQFSIGRKKLMAKFAPLQLKT